jgi:glutamine amidotransferase
MGGKRVVVVDYGMGNMLSVLNAFRYLGCEAEATNDPLVVASSPCLVLPGVGSFRKAMETIRSKRLDKALLEGVLERGAKLLGICLGMQLLFEAGTEDGGAEGLGLLRGIVERFPEEKMKGLKTPHVGFDTLSFSRREGLFEEIPEDAGFYFVHSYRVSQRRNDDYNEAICVYGEPFLAAVQRGNICGAQFHPEKSQSNGLLLLRNFLRMSDHC